MGENMLEKRIGALLMSKDDKIAEKCVGKIIELINNKDISGLKEVFSENALKKIESFENDAEQFLEYFDDKITSYDNDGGSREIGISEGEKKVLYKHSFDIVIMNEQYHLLVMEVTEDQTDEKNVGVYAIKVKTMDGCKAEILGTIEAWEGVSYNN